MTNVQPSPRLRPCLPAARELSLSTDLYEFTMGASYAALGMNDTATFSLFVRKLPENRPYLVVAGIEEALARIAMLGFDDEAIAALEATGLVRRDFLDRLRGVRFTGDVWAVPEGRVVFADEPILEVTAPLIEAQLVESLALNAIHFPTLVATKASRCVAAARGRSLVEFGLRRIPGIADGVVVARACYLAGFDATSNVLAAARLGIRTAGTVAHSFVQACASEREAFRAFAETFPGPATLIIDTYDTERGAHHVVEVAESLRASGIRIAGVRIDSGNLHAVSRRVRAILDAAGLSDIRIFVSGGLDEYAIDALMAAEAPIDAFGVGTRIGVSADAPVLDMAYKLVEYRGTPRLKLSEGKVTLAGRKQVWRRHGPDDRFERDVIATRDEPVPGDAFEPLLQPVTVQGHALPLPSLEQIRNRHREECERLPDAIRGVHARTRYPVSHSDALAERQSATVSATRLREERT